LVCLACELDANAAIRCAAQGKQNVQGRIIQLRTFRHAFGRLRATINRLSTASGGVAIRNGDLPYFGL